MEYLQIGAVLLLCFLPAMFISMKTDMRKKRGCGRGCAGCGNRKFCHRKKLRP